ncbi:MULTISPECIES: hypothetical protein [unclassified Nonomuraea]|uniref:hypothetical protein n=1 Tax=Nonomuraea sp. NPDC047529 TaxID=3155623 RepID=UPI0034030CB1
MGTREPKSKWVRQWVAESRAEGMAEGIAEGEARGEAMGQARGEAKGEAKAILRILAARGIAVREEEAERVFRCTDLDVLESWIDRALTVEAAEELFDPS